MEQQDRFLLELIYKQIYAVHPPYNNLKNKSWGSLKIEFFKKKVIYLTQLSTNSEKLLKVLTLDH